MEVRLQEGEAGAAPPASAAGIGQALHQPAVLGRTDSGCRLGPARSVVRSPCARLSPAVGVWRSLVSAPVWGTGGRQFKSGHADHVLRLVCPTLCTRVGLDAPSGSSSGEQAELSDSPLPGRSGQGQMATTSPPRSSVSFAPLPLPGRQECNNCTTASVIGAWKARMR